MDQTCGIDFIKKDNIGMQGIATRVQWGTNWKTFTVRTKRHTTTGTNTEFKKRNEQIAKGYFYPAFTLQAYFNNKTEKILLGIGVIKTTDLYNFMNNSPDKVHSRKSDNEFVFVKWNDLNGLVKTIVPKLPTFDTS